MDKEAMKAALEQAALVNFKTEELATIDAKLWQLLTTDVCDAIAAPRSEFETALTAPLSSIAFMVSRGRKEAHGERVRLERIVTAFILGARAVYHIGQEEPEPCEQPEPDVDETGDEDVESLEEIDERA